MGIQRRWRIVTAVVVGIGIQLAVVAASAAVTGGADWPRHLIPA